MRVRLTLTALALTLAALQSGGPASAARALGTIAVPMPDTTAGYGDPSFKPMAFPARGDVLDQWCKAVKSGAMAAICSDEELRGLAIERLHAFNDTYARLTPDQQKTLVADQNGWALSYAQRCGVWSNVLPALPIAPETRECMAKAGRERLTYLQNYETVRAENGPSPLAAGTIVPPPPGSAPAAPELRAAEPRPATPPSATTPPGPSTKPESSTIVTEVLPPPQAASPPPTSAAKGEVRAAGPAAAAPPVLASPTVPPASTATVVEPTSPDLPETGVASPARPSAFQTAAMAGAILVAAFVVGFWVLAVFRTMAARLDHRRPSSR